MTNQTHTNLVFRSSFALALALAIWSPNQVRAAEPAAEKMVMDGKMAERCQEMIKQKQKIKEEMKARDAELTEQLAKMNRAPEDEKVSLMAAVITQFIEQRISMDAKREKMQEEMMHHMRMHMMHIGKEPMLQCPMMERMKDMDESPSGAHQERQTEQE